MNKKIFHKKAFTLTELLVVISIIGTLSGVVIAAVNSAREKARITKASQDLITIAKSIVIAETESGKKLGTLLFENGVAVPGNIYGRTGYISFQWMDGKTVTDDQCKTQTILQVIEQNSNGLVSGLSSAMSRDPWGSPYLIDDGQSSFYPCERSHVISLFHKNNNIDANLRTAIWNQRMTPFGTVKTSDEGFLLSYIPLNEEVSSSCSV